MIAIFERLEINRIQFQQGDSEVVVNCRITQAGEKIAATLLITFSDLNRLLARLGNSGVEVDSSRFHVIDMGNDERLYECDSKAFGLDSFTIEEPTFYNPVRQIRA
ncbi:hypothetical protein GCM10009118_33490 [Wandonia haliotis]|uniref:Uncharacterized protein n=1 Tax=Wandonia haliotis TaxID=574963 RepID=A0ABP3Y9U2_9FLAO